MNAEQLNIFLHQHIPLSRAMQMRVCTLEPGLIRVALPLQPNLNPHGSVFGGALGALGLATGWMLLHAELCNAEIEATLVGKRSETDFLAPALGDCIAEARCSPDELSIWFARLRAKGRARIALDTVTRFGNVEVARHYGVYTALPSHPQP